MMPSLSAPAARHASCRYPVSDPACATASSAVITCANAEPYKAFESRATNPVRPSANSAAASCAAVGGWAYAPSAARASERAFGEINGGAWAVSVTAPTVGTTPPPDFTGQHRTNSTIENPRSRSRPSVFEITGAPHPTSAALNSDSQLNYT